MSEAAQIRILHRGQEAYQTSFDAMRAFTDARNADTVDELLRTQRPEAVAGHLARFFRASS